MSAAHTSDPDRQTRNAAGWVDAMGGRLVGANANTPFASTCLGAQRSRIRSFWAATTIREPGARPSAPDREGS